MKIAKLYIDSFRGLSSESWMLAIVMLINRTGSMVLPFLGVYMTSQLGFSLKEAGIVLSFFGIGSVVGSWFGGMITDRIGEFKVQTFSLLFSVPLFLIIPLFHSQVGMAFIMFILSCISEAFRPANSVAVTKYAKSQNITRAFSLNRMAVNLGFSIGPALGGILSSISYDFLFYTNAAGALLAAITYVAFFRKRNYRNEAQPKNILELKPTSPYKDYKFVLFCILCLSFSVCFFQLFNTLTIFYKEEAQLSQEYIGYLLGFSGFIIVLLEMLLVQVAEKKFSLSFTLGFGTLLCGISYAMLGFGTHIAYLLFSMTILCIGEIWTLPFMATVTAMRSGKDNKGSYMGLLGMAFSMSFIITPSLGTFIAEQLGFKTLWIGTGILMAITALGFHLLIPKMLNKKIS